MPTGIVKWFNGRKGYGFIEPEDGGNDVFVHVTALKDSGIKFLNEGDKVSYELTENRGRMAAGNLSLDGESSSDSDEVPTDDTEEAPEEEAPEEEAAEEEAAEEEAAEEEAAEEEAVEEEAVEEEDSEEKS
tara:strand:- start:163 stop:555 length:393 start_codon:yes stop_codon:yes gene_type:complete